MLCYVTCKDYSVISTGSSNDDAPAECRRLEQERNDGFAVFASNGGVDVADADGWYLNPGSAPDAATATGMYDRDV